MKEESNSGFAIVGMACIFPGAPDLDAYWHNLERGIDAITPVPASRWDSVFYDPDSGAADRLYCRRGGFVDAHARFDPLEFGVMPVTAEGAEPDQMLALLTASRALADAGLGGNRASARRGAVILGRGGYMGAGMVRLAEHVRVSQQLVDSLRTLLPDLTEQQLNAVRSEFRASLGPCGPDTAIGLVPNLVASRIANRLDLHGPAYTVDAACASSLVAVDLACRELEQGRCDLAIAGGVHLCHDVTLWSVFCQLGALSRSQQIRPFDRRADGLLIGEGIGMLVLKRHDDARQSGDRIYAVVRGTGVSSDGRATSLMHPLVEGQLAALEQAWRMARLDPSTVGLIEAHGTGTPAGDEAELTSLTRFFGGDLPGRPGLGSVKSMIGHAMPAAGAAGLIKAALAIYHGVRPPTIHCEEPHESLRATGFRLLAEAEPWSHNGVPRRAGVNAFGFGGVNAHVIVEGLAQHSPGRIVRAKPPIAAVEPMLRFSAETPEALIEALQGDAGPATDAHPCRLVMHDPTPERRAKALKIVERGQPWRGRGGIWFAPRGLLSDGGKIAFLFPGVDARFEPRIEDVARHFGVPVPRHATAGDLDPEDLEQVGVGIIGVGRLLDHALGELGVRPDAVAGHSIGEWSGMIAAGVLQQSTVDALISTLVPGTLQVPGVVFVAAGCGAEQAEEALRDLDQIGVSHDNCPHQILLCGREDSADTAIARLAGRGILCQKLRFRSGFHSPLFADYILPNRVQFASLPLSRAQVPLWSATTGEPYPGNPEAIAALALEHLVRPVRFRQLIEKLYGEGVRVFIQVGTGRLVGFVGDTLHGRPHAALAANEASRSGLAQLARVAGALWAEGGVVRFDRLPGGTREPAAAKPGVQRTMSLRLGAPLARIHAPLELRRIDVDPELPAEAISDPILAEFEASMRTLRGAQRDVRRAWHEAAPSGARGPREHRRTMSLSVERYPTLVDHCFYHQPEGWPVLADHFPVMPMTTILELMRQLAHELVPEASPVAVEKLRALRWIVVEPPVEVSVTTRFDGIDRVEVSIEGYASGTVRLAQGYAPAPGPRPFAAGEGQPTPIDARELYSERWMFHGPRFQGIRKLGAFSPAGIHGVIESLPAPGATLDNAGQLLGYWISLQGGPAPLAFPASIERITFHGPQPAPGALLECQVHVLEDTERTVRADLEVTHEGRVWVRVEGWVDRRFETGERLWSLLRFPERAAFGEMRHGAYCLVREAWRSPASRDLIARGSLGRVEREDYAALESRSQRAWLLGRMAIKDAVRHRLWAGGHAALFPVELCVTEAPDGELVVRGPYPGALHAAVAQADDLAVARVSSGRTGIAIRRIEGEAGDRDEWAARSRAACEAAGGGEVLQVDGERLRVGEVWVETRREDRHIVGWTVD